jgi:hypothetical protein
MATKKFPPVDRIREALRYEDGHLFWLMRPRSHFANTNAWKTWNIRFSGKEAGYLWTSPNGRRSQWMLRFDYLYLQRGMTVWVMHHGQWPELEIDHRNRKPLDDRIDNLRLATSSQNKGNTGKRRSNTSGYKGVCRKNGKWVAEITKNGRLAHLGCFVDPREAHSAYMRAAREHFGEFAYDGASEERSDENC